MVRQGILYRCVIKKLECVVALISRHGDSGLKMCNHSLRCHARSGRVKLTLHGGKEPVLAPTVEYGRWARE